MATHLRILLRHDRTLYMAMSSVRPSRFTCNDGLDVISQQQEDVHTYPVQQIVPIFTGSGLGDMSRYICCLKVVGTISSSNDLLDR